ncbi:MAG TPA: hypothetical protein H9662_04460 [Firmicutes bacterium]|nr:hypothetical protein [Bacillota bacterium]
MKITLIECTQCGAPIQIDESKDFVVCKYCGSSYNLTEIKKDEKEKSNSPCIENTQIRKEELKKICNFLDRGEQIQAIKLFRTITGADLKTAKDTIENLKQYNAYK